MQAVIESGKLEEAMHLHNEMSYKVDKSLLQLFIAVKMSTCQGTFTNIPLHTCIVFLFTELYVRSGDS